MPVMVKEMDLFVEGKYWAASILVRPKISPI
jgi:hypothetical protein